MELENYTNTVKAALLVYSANIQYIKNFNLSISSPKDHSFVNNHYAKYAECYQHSVVFLNSITSSSKKADPDVVHNNSTENNSTTITMMSNRYSQKGYLELLAHQKKQITNQLTLILEAHQLPTDQHFSFEIEKIHIKMMELLQSKKSFKFITLFKRSKMTSEQRAKKELVRVQQEKLAAEKMIIAEKERLEHEKLIAIQAAREDAARAEREKLAAEQRAKEEIAKAQQEKIAAENHIIAEKERLEREKLIAVQAAREDAARIEREKILAEQQANKTLAVQHENTHAEDSIVVKTEKSDDEDSNISSVEDTQIQNETIEKMRQKELDLQLKRQELKVIEEQLRTTNKEQQDNIHALIAMGRDFNQTERELQILLESKRNLENTLAELKQKIEKIESVKCENSDKLLTLERTRRQIVQDILNIENAWQRHLKNLQPDVTFIKSTSRRRHSLELEEAAIKAKEQGWYRGEDLNLHGVAPTNT